jgi:hypothetical protein
MRELVSYAVGCMFGRYSLDKPGLILANQGETLADYLRQVPEPSFPADADNVIPMLDGDWFTDDIAERFRKFLRVTFGDEHYEENLASSSSRRWARRASATASATTSSSEFYTDHVKRYKKRPIYWLFQQPQRQLQRADLHAPLPPGYGQRGAATTTCATSAPSSPRTRTIWRRSASAPAASQGEKTKALKEIEKLTKMIAELEEYERDVLYPLATEQVEIDLDDGVKVNYPKLGAA